MIWRGFCGGRLAMWVPSIEWGSWGCGSVSGAGKSGLGARFPAPLKAKDCAVPRAPKGCTPKGARRSGG
ncbi:hypothetical protein GCM10018775_17210 [Streptomyces umbrinus]|nr:hypothetical protein GCM10018775_17210 [Streptomyces umbrinus]